MNPEDIARLAAELKQLHTAEEIRRFRQRLDRQTAQAVILHPSISALERGAISLCLQFSATSDGRQGAGPGLDAAIVEDTDTLWTFDNTP